MFGYAPAGDGVQLLRAKQKKLRLVLSFFYFYIVDYFFLIVVTITYVQTTIVALSMQNAAPSAP